MTTPSGETILLPGLAGRVFDRPPAPPDAPRESASLSPLRAGPPVDAHTFAGIRRRAVLDGCKWDPQVGDVSTLASFPLVMRRGVWRQLTRWAETLAAETLAAEAEILERPQLMDDLGLPGALRRVLRTRTPHTPGVARTMRFDFHFTTDGWRISEVNSDVPGGFTESSFFTTLMAQQFPQFSSAGDVAGMWADAIRSAAGPGGIIALLSAPGYMEDQQIMVFLGTKLRDRGCAPCLANPTQVAWRDGLASLETSWCRAPANVLVRFYQGEWLARLPRRFGWEHFFRGGRTPVANPGAAVIAESKRFPLVWNRLSTALPTWRRLLPETRDPREAPWSSDDGWLLKSALSNTGDDVSIRALLTRGRWLEVTWSARLRPGRWLAQRWFESVALPTPAGPMHACIGIYTIEGRTAGAYARLASRPLIDYSAVDAVLLLEGDNA